MSSLLRKVKSRLFIQSRRHAFHLLDGQYRSRARGRSMDFDDLREYAAGDDIRDIDWSATARSASTLVRRYHAERKQVVTFLVDTGRSMAAVTRVGEAKRDLAITTVGAMAYLSARHGDDVAMIYGNVEAVLRVPVGRSDAHLERMLRVIESATSLSAPPGDMGSILDYAVRTLRSRMILVCVTDEAALTDEMSQALRRLRSRHEVIWICLGDSDLSSRTRKAYVDVADGGTIPQFVLGQRQVRDAIGRAWQNRTQERAEILERIGIPHATVHADKDVLPELIALLSKRGYARG